MQPCVLDVQSRAARNDMLEVKVHALLAPRSRLEALSRRISPPNLTQRFHNFRRIIASAHCYSQAECACMRIAKITIWLLSHGLFWCHLVASLSTTF
jgi:hypothetical protein